MKGLVYEFGPDGTQFNEPAKLVLPSAGEFSADVMHFTRFAVRFNGVVSDDCGFSACGGDIVGTWTVTSVCADISGPVIDVCPTALANLELNLTGTATFNSDGTRTDTFSGQSTITYTLDAACTYVVDGNTLTTTLDADGTTETAEFCVQGNEVRLQQTDGLAVLTWIATKQ